MARMCYRWETAVTYNPQMERDKKLDEFVQILGRIRYLVGKETIAHDPDVDLGKAIERLRLSGKNKDADELTDLIKWADTLKAQQQAKS
jgi:hypothetical protein